MWGGGRVVTGFIGACVGVRGQLIQSGERGSVIKDVSQEETSKLRANG